MRAIPCSLAFAVASSIPWMAGCAVGAGDEANLPGLLDGGDASPGDAVPGSDAVTGSDAARGSDAETRVGDASGEERATSLVDGSDGGPKGEGGVVADATVGSLGDAPADSPPATAPGDTAGLRLANWSSGAPAIDFCVAPHDGAAAFRGPMMAVAAGDGGAGGQVAYSEVSAYFPVRPSAYDVRIVIGAPGADCSLGGLLVPDMLLTGLATGSNTTVALVGQLQGASADSGLGLQLITLTDDLVVPSPKNAPSPPPDAGPIDRFALRLVHAAPGFGAVSLGAGPVDGVKKWMKSVVFGHTNQGKDGGGADDSNGYLAVPAWTEQPVHVWLSANEGDAGMGPDLLPSPSLTAAGGSVLTLILTGTPTTGAVQLVECVDDGATIDMHSPCRTVTVSTCGNGRLDPFEDCDCSSIGTASTNMSKVPSSDPKCVGQTENGALPDICSTSCRLN